jgi:predicted small secreted protein
MTTKRLPGLVVLGALGALLAGVSGCNTLSGMGEDVESVGDAITGTPAERTVYRDIDQNDDGVISRTEWDRYYPAYAERWSEYDRNANDELDEDEFARFEAWRLEQ